MSRGRSRGSRNTGYFHRPKRGWFAKNRLGKFVPLLGPNNQRLRDEGTPRDVLEAAYARFVIGEQQKAKQPVEPVAGTTVLEVCTYYLEQLAKGRRSTYIMRGKTLFDFTVGFPPKFWEPEPERNKPEPKAKPKPGSKDRIHDGYGMMPVADLKPHHVQKWCDDHKGWGPSGARTRIQALKRALNYAKEMGLIDYNPIRGMKVPKTRGRVSYLDDVQAQAIIDNCRSEQLKSTIRALLRTGARPDELCKLTPDHVSDHGEYVVFTLQPDEAKTNKERVIRVKEKWIVDHVRASTNEKFIFRNSKGGQWTRPTLSKKFLTAKRRAEKNGVTFEPDTCLYSCRHTYCKNALLGRFNGGQPIPIEVLAELVGNTPDVCRKHYLKWTKSFDEHFIKAC